MKKGAVADPGDSENQAPSIDCSYSPHSKLKRIWSFQKLYRSILGLGILFKEHLNSAEEAVASSLWTSICQTLQDALTDFSMFKCVLCLQDTLCHHISTDCVRLTVAKRIDWLLSDLLSNKGGFSQKQLITNVLGFVLDDDLETALFLGEVKFTGVGTDSYSWDGLIIWSREGERDGWCK